LEGEAGIAGGDGGVDDDLGRVAVGGIGGGGDEGDFVARRYHAVGVIGGVLVHAEGGGEEDVAEAEMRGGDDIYWRLRVCVIGLHEAGPLVQYDV